MVDWNTDLNKHAKYRASSRHQTKEATVCSNETTKMHFDVHMLKPLKHVQGGGCNW
jgi:hypothetical protein